MSKCSNTKGNEPSYNFNLFIIWIDKLNIKPDTCRNQYKRQGNKLKYTLNPVNRSQEP